MKQEMSWFLGGLYKNVKREGLRILGRIRVSKYPMWINYRPRMFDVKGIGLRRAMELLQPGDVVARRYRGYMNGWFIPGRFTHTGIYVGDGKIIHALDSGVQITDILDFLRCDGYAILRIVEKDAKKRERIIEEAIRRANSYLGYSYDFDFDICEDYRDKAKVKESTKSFYCHELVRSCFPDLEIDAIEPKLWNGMIRSRKKQYLAQSFFDSDDFDLVYDSDYSDVRSD